MSSPRPSKKKLLSPEVLQDAIVEVSTVSESQGVKAAVLGGFAMQHFGSPRLTGDIDFVAERELDGVKRLAALSFGGHKFKAQNGTPVDWILREDEYSALYEEALLTATKHPAGFLIVRAEYLAAMKFATRRPIDQEDLVFLLQQPRLVNRKKAREIVFRLIGGRFARDEFDLVIDEAKWRKYSGRRAYDA